MRRIAVWVAAASLAAGAARGGDRLFRSVDVERLPLRYSPDAIEIHDIDRDGRGGETSS